MDKENKSKNGWGGARKNSGGRREGSGRKKLPPELKKKTIRKGKAVYFRLSDEAYKIIEDIAEKNNTTVNKYIQQTALKSIGLEK
ncbi:ribbon-helix-helix domain-containing protein [Brachyspira hyodysenteriae]|uniref:ribbon-helix-helix domain-containing protein n=1 Tax=Brachyspira hyodysenteriae TaxID=159 RepID=UPI002B26303F|nr:ribbon-helix-helix domain-containing protein [Brachyspira hyodysenteriae]WPC36837.1 ribbon-helix-helix domain-containing protein [Brachyspira hyodysenteriae]